jgi:pilus assembly protein HofO
MRIGVERLSSLRGWPLALLSVAVLASVAYLAFWSAEVRLADPASPPLQAQWRRVLPLRAMLAQRVADEWTFRRFSPLEMLNTGVTLRTWQPRVGGGDMLAEVDWQAVPPLFAWLADCGVRVTAFSLSYEEASLQMSLQLENDDEA